MNIVSKSLLTGLAVSLLVFFLNDKFSGKSEENKYSITYTINIAPDLSSPYPFSFFTIKEILEKRFEKAGYHYKTGYTDTTAIKVTLHGLTDTNSYRSMSGSGARLQFRELYSLFEVKDMLRLFVDEAKALHPPKKIASLPQENRDTTTKNGMAEYLPYDSMANMPEEDFSLIEFSEPYSRSTSDALIYPGMIGYMRLKDTAEAMKIFHSPKVAAAMLPGLELFFGKPEKRYKEKEQFISLYCLRGNDSNGKAVLENEDIVYAQVEFTPQNQVAISLSFTKAGQAKWADMTRKNVNKSIAFLIDETVISAPNVNEPILDGITSISGGYSVEEARDISVALRSVKLPAKMNLTSVDIKQENLIGKLARKLLIAAAAFLITAAIAFFVFKTLKSS